ncbi:ectoine synthase [Chromobacterium phragmitis]|uniref:L-ectoine synthase n=1 Tax=Chromobacterium phragmitis TaxID=2202141 RepID=A0A344UHV0_9NEIS|nr:ectoine synthase [Chromobacterium phragmitis]AXE34848.1 L-ectoine synthase [Chromobacterium phragmitis]
MIVRHLEKLLGTERDVDGGNWISRRLLTADDGMGFSMHDTIIKSGTETPIWYKHHLEAVYCIAGKGEIELVGSGEIFPIQPGMLYALNRHDRHLLRASETLQLICVFNPPVTGREVHDADGAYAPSPAIAS